jgi:hypothetical protein
LCRSEEEGVSGLDLLSKEENFGRCIWYDGLDRSVWLSEWGSLLNHTKLSSLWAYEISRDMNDVWIRPQTYFSNQKECILSATSLIYFYFGCCNIKLCSWSEMSFRSSNIVLQRN